MSDQPLLAYKRYGVFSPRKIFAHLAWVALLTCRTLVAWSDFLACRVLLARKLLLIALVLGLFASVAVSIQCTSQYSQLNTRLEKYSHANQNFSAQLATSALRLRALDKQTLGLSKRIASINGVFTVKEPPQIDWLSPLVGATIIPELCSPPSPPKELKFEYSNLETPENLKNQEAPESHKNGWYSRWLGIKAQFPTKSGLSAPGPAKALLPWTEAERRYCVPEGRVLQLAVSSPRYILPMRLVVEHWPKGKVPGSLMRKAPKDMELWSYIEVEDDAAKVRDESLASYPSLTANYGQQNESFHSKQCLKFPWIPIGVFRYEIDMARNVQEYQIKYDLKIPMKRFAIRVISNWGYLDETCLVRVRLYGEEWTSTKLDKS